MTKRIFRSICMVAMTVVLACMTIVMGSLYSYFSRIQNNQLKAQTMLAAQGVASDGLNYLTGLDLGDCRITWIDSEGNVLYDSACEPDEMENHLEREEVRKALAYGYGESARYSATLMNKAVYSAKLLPDGTLIMCGDAQVGLEPIRREQVLDLMKLEAELLPEDEKIIVLAVR